MAADFSFAFIGVFLGCCIYICAYGSYISLVAVIKGVAPKGLIAFAILMGVVGYMFAEFLLAKEVMTITGFATCAILGYKQRDGWKIDSQPNAFQKAISRKKED